MYQFDRHSIVYRMLCGIVERRAAADGENGYYPKGQLTLLFSGGCSEEEGPGVIVFVLTLGV